MVLKVVESLLRNISFPLKVALSSVNHGPHPVVLLHVFSKFLADLQVLGRNGTLSTGRKGHFSLLVSLNCFSHVSSKGNDVEVFVDVVHDLALEEGLSSIIHDLITELGLCNVLSQLLDTSASSFL